MAERFSGSIEPALTEGRLANEDAVMMVRSSRVEDGAARGMRAIDVRVWGGIDLRILPDRGFDLGQAWYQGVPLAWVSRMGEMAPLEGLEGVAWGETFGGGLVVTCGLRNVGMPSEGHGLHGTYSHLPAREVEVRRHISAEAQFVEATALIEDAGDSHHLRVERAIRTHALAGIVELTDVTTNLGPDAEETPLLYHFNFGFPLWSAGAELRLEAIETIPRDDVSKASLDGWARPPEVHESEERVLEHLLEGSDGWGNARVLNEAVGVGVTIRWRTEELPRFHQWVNPSPGMYVLGLEPANCSTSGRAHDRDLGRLPSLGPGESRQTRLRVEADPA